MATLILTAVGTAVGGPIGGAIGAILGQQVDAQIFAPKARQGPRLGELSVQTSSYGTAIPKIFGTLRVAGTVIWATDLQESASTSGGGKGRPQTTQYSYSASFAVALSGRRILGVKRIWADGKLLRGEAGDFKSETGYRLYLGDEEQSADPLIAAAEGIDQAPAFRGIAYALFEDFQLADYGNRIPSLTFEVEADAAPVGIGAMAAELSGGVLEAGATPALSGFAAGGDSIRSAIEAVARIVPLAIRDDGASLVIGTGSGDPAVVAMADFGARSGGSGGRTEFARRAADGIAGEVSIAYYDVARDFQTGLQRAASGSSKATVERLTLPAALTASSAKAMAERRLAAIRAGRASAKVHLGWRRADLRPGDHVRLEGEAGLWNVQRWTLDHMVITLELAQTPDGEAPDAAVAGEGRATSQPDLLHGPTTLRLLDLPLGEVEGGGRPVLLVAAAGVQPGWRRAALQVSYDRGATWNEGGPTAASAVMGAAATTLGAGGSALIDVAGSVDVELLNDAMWLESRDDDALVGGGNLALLGDELIQFGVAAPLGGRRFRLSRLLRGRRGTEWAAGSHVPGDPFALIDRPSLATIQPPLALLGGEVRLMATSLGDPAPVIESLVLTGETLRPPSPVHLTGRWTAAGDIEIAWARRSRSGWVWLSGTDTPLAEEGEAYGVTLSGDGVERSVSVTEPGYRYAKLDQTADGLTGPLTVSVVQLGTSASSRAAEMVIPPQS